LSINAPVNFLQLGRFGKYGEQRYRQHFEADFDFFSFNTTLIQQHFGARQAIAFDPSYIPKSGRETDGVGWFWSGSANQSKWGLEIGGLAALDIDNHTAMHLEAVQTIPLQGETLLEFYARIITQRADELKKISNIVVADAYFSKEPFVSKLMSCGLDVISRLRDDVRLRYIIQIKKTGKQGRTKTNGDKVNLSCLDYTHFRVEKETDDFRINTAIVYAVALKRIVRVVYVEFLKNGKTTSAKVYFCTNIEIEAIDILEIYQIRFQIEFLYRDAKQHTSLTTCQARNKEKMNFHFNMSLTAINVAKIVHWYSIPAMERKSFSMSDVKTINHNTLLLERFIDMFAVKPYLLKNNQNIKELLLYGTIAA